MRKPVRVLFVCLGNICRSPTAEGLFRHLLREQGLDGRILVESCGTGDWHLGEAPDERSQAEARRRGIDISCKRSRLVRSSDFERFDYIVAMDKRNLQDLQRLCPREHKAKLSTLMSFAPELGIAEVPDPYYGGARGFERVYEIVESGTRGLLKAIQEEWRCTEAGHR